MKEKHIQQLQDCITEYCQREDVPPDRSQLASDASGQLDQAKEKSEQREVSRHVSEAMWLLAESGMFGPPSAEPDVDESAVHDDQQRQNRLWSFCFVLLIFISSAFWLVESELTEWKLALLGIQCSVLVAIVGYFMTAPVNWISEGKLGTFGKVSIRATGSVSLFMFVMCWWASYVMSNDQPSAVSSGATSVETQVRGSNSGTETGS